MDFKELKALICEEFGYDSDDIRPETLLMEIVSDGDGNYHQDIDPANDEGTDADGRSNKMGIWGLRYNFSQFD